MTWTCACGNFHSSIPGLVRAHMLSCGQVITGPPLPSFSGTITTTTKEQTKHYSLVIPLPLLFIILVFLLLLALTLYAWR